MSLADHEKLDTNDIRVRRRFRFVPPPRDEDVSDFAEFDHGESLAVEKYVGQGRVIVLGIPLTMRDWSELAKAQAFVVMVQDWVAYLTQPQSTRHNLSPGDPITVHLAETENRDAFLKTPHGDQVELTADTVQDGVSSVRAAQYCLVITRCNWDCPAIRSRFMYSAIRRNRILQVFSKEDHQLLADTAGLSSSLLNSNLSSTSQSDPVWPMLLINVNRVHEYRINPLRNDLPRTLGTAAISETSERVGEAGLAMPTQFEKKLATREPQGAGRG